MNAQKQTENMITVMAVKKKYETAVCFHAFTHSLWQVGVELPQQRGSSFLKKGLASSQK